MSSEASDDQRPWRTKIHELAAQEKQDDRFGDHTYTALSALIEVMDAQSAAISTMEETLRHGLDVIQHWMPK